MESNQIETCTNCSTPLPPIGYYCGACLTQCRCKSCDALLLKNNVGCIHCGTPRENHSWVSGDNQPRVNTFRVHETATARTIDASFSDNVGKDLAYLLRDTYATKLNARGEWKLPPPDANFGNDEGDSVNEHEVQEGETVNLRNNQQNAVNGRKIEYPTLLSIAMKKLPGPETEWIVVYSFYASNFGEKIFKREDLIELYKQSNRFVKNKTTNQLGTNIIRCVQAGYVNPLSGGYSILEAGIVKAKEITSRTSASNTRNSRSSSGKSKESNESTKGKEKKSSSSTEKALKRLSNIDFEPSGKESLKAYFKKFKLTNHFQRILIFVSYMQEVLKINITPDHIYTCFDDLELSIPLNLMQIIRNTKSKTGWIETEDIQKINLTVKGRNQIKDWSKKPDR